MAIQTDGYMVKFAAKDTAYYWGDDPDAISDPTHQIVSKYDQAWNTPIDLEILRDLVQTRFYAKDAMIYAQGSVFPTVPGRYPLPHNEGHYIITSEQKVIMHTNKNGNPYYHYNI